MDELKKCPICGGDDVLLTHIGMYPVVVCKQCWRNSGLHLSKKDAVTEWNRRCDDATD